MATPDLLYLGLIAIAFVFDHFVVWPAFLRRSKANPSRARVRLWSGAILMLWILAAIGLILWLAEGRDWGALRLVAPQGWRRWASIGLVLAFTIICARTVVKIARSKRRRRIKTANPHLEKLSPHTGSELSWWIALSLSAGFCEEFIFRGYLIWAFQPVIGWWGAAALSLTVFAVAHAYQGSQGVLATGLVGFLFTLVVLIFRSLWPAIALHALLDLQQGLMAWLLLRRVEGERRMVAA